MHFKCRVIFSDELTQEIVRNNYLIVYHLVSKTIPLTFVKSFPINYFTLKNITVNLLFLKKEQLLTYNIICILRSPNK